MPKNTANINNVIVGTVVGVWGLKGYLKVKPFTDNPHRLSPGSQMLLGESLATISDIKDSGSKTKIKFDIVNDRNQAESFIGNDLTIPESELENLPSSTYYYFEIIGIKVQTEDCNPIGKVSEILPAGGTDVYVISRGQEKEILLPATTQTILNIDTEENIMTVRLADKP